MNEAIFFNLSLLILHLGEKNGGEIRGVQGILRGDLNCGPVKVPSDQSVKLLIKTPFNKSLGK